MNTLKEQVKIKDLPLLELLGNENININDIAVDSNDVFPGTLFVALKGSMHDGHNYIDEAIQRGAAAVLIDEETSMKNTLKTHSPVPLIRVSDTREALQHLVSFFFDYPATKLQLIGITGTNGKTTTTYLIDSLLNQAGKKCGMLSTIAYRYGTHTTKAKNTTPGLLELQRNFSKMQKDEMTHVVMEVSSHALKQGRVAGCVFKNAVFTNLTQDHLDYHGTMEAYFESKKILFSQTKETSIINIDDPWGKQLQQETQKVWAYGIEHKKDLYPIQFKSSLNGIWMIAKTPIGNIEVSSALVGRHNVYNILAAIGVAISQGLTKEEISTGISALKEVPGRFEKIECDEGFTVIVDYAHTPDALDRLLQSIEALDPKQILTLFGCGGDRDRGKRPQMGYAAAAHSQQIIVTSDNPRNEPPLAIIKEIEAGVLSYKRKHKGIVIDHEIISDRGQAIWEIINRAKEGDIVVIAGKGHETDQLIEDRILPFDDREVVRQVLAEKKRRSETGHLNETTH